MTKTPNTFIQKSQLAVTATPPLLVLAGSVVEFELGACVVTAGLAKIRGDASTYGEAAADGAADGAAAPESDI